MTSPRPIVRPRALLLLLAAVATLLALSAGPASAHASLAETVPFDGQQLDTAPDRVTLTFDEPVTSTTGALRVFDADGDRADTGEQTQPAAETVAVALRDGLDDGTYVVTYRITSADGHLLRGAFLFEVGDAATVDDATLAALFAGGDGILPLAAGLVRALAYAGVLLAAGAGVWARRIAGDDETEQAAGLRLAGRAGGVALVATLLAVPAQAMLASGLGFGVLASAAFGETLGSSVGVAAVVRLLGLVVLLVAVRRDAVLPTMAGGTLALLSFVVDGHTRTVDPPWLLLVGDTVHLAAASAWLGGLVLLAGSVRRRRLADDPVGAAGLVARFSGMAAVWLGAVTVAGLAMSWALVRAPRTLTSTDYGWTLLVKVGLVAAVALAAAYNRRQLVPAIAAAGGVAEADGEGGAAAAVADPAAAWSALGRTTRFEAGLLLVVVAVTAFLVNLRPAAEEAGITGAYDTVVQVTDELSVNLVVDPNRAGFNEIHLYVFDATGRPSSDLTDVALRLSQPDRDIGPIDRVPFVAGAGHWQLDGRDLALPGRWTIDVTLGIDRFTTETFAVDVVVNPS